MSGAPPAESAPAGAEKENLAPIEAVALRGDDKRRYIRRLFDQLAPRYDLLNGIISLGQVQIWRARALRALPLNPGHRVLDVGCGSGASTVYLRGLHPGVEAEGMDLAPAMIEEARRKHASLRFFVGDVCAIPRETGSFEGVVTVFTSRNFPEFRSSLAEMLRVVRPGGFLLILDTFRPTGPSWWRAWQRFWLRRVVPLMAAPFTDPDAFRYLGESILAHVRDDECADLLRELGCPSVRIRRFSLGTASALLAERGPDLSSTAAHRTAPPA